ncbi:triose-phosphate isomerase [Algibacillus agarilyticus]|uniref:triose-phosphate isomerase n=1 Tax=Algibacillus agarilyticus TaxID=2234133 RepID=UPI000DD0B671|nr:triose-phosphate isomerase [Algibacillus agarilyticus]
MQASFMVVANWKMNGCRDRVTNLSHELITRCGFLNQPKIVLCPPYIYLERVQETLASSKISLGAQDLSCENNGAFTGNISGEMLVDVGVQYVIIGHSERRLNNAETNDIILKKLSIAQFQGMTSIFCIGENIVEKQLGNTFKAIDHQLKPVITLIKNDPSIKCIVAYEPVWSIGTGCSASVQDVERVNKYIKQIFNDLNYPIKIIYGGSVNEMNIEQFVAIKSLDGVIVGNASLSADKLINICMRVEKQTMNTLADIV